MVRQHRPVAELRIPVGDGKLLADVHRSGEVLDQRHEGDEMVLRARVDAGAAAILVTHEARHAAWADRVVFLKDGVILDTSGPIGEADQLLSGVPRGGPGSPRCRAPAGGPAARAGGPGCSFSCP